MVMLQNKERQQRRESEHSRNLMNEFATLHSVSGFITGVQRGFGGWFFADMTNQQLPPMPQSEEKQTAGINPKSAIPLPVELIRDALEINESSPSFLTWKIRPRNHFAKERTWKIFNTQHAARPAGSAAKGCGTHYWLVGVNGRLYKGHRIVWILAHGVDPGCLHIDHIDGNGLNNNPNNLRLATQGENMMNQGKRSDNTSGYPGTYWNKNGKKWKSRIMVKGREIHLGYFTELEKAITARRAAEIQYFGEYSYGTSRNPAARNSS